MNKYLVISAVMFVTVSVVFYYRKLLFPLTNNQPFSNVWTDKNSMGETYQNTALNMLESSIKIMKKLDIDVIPIYGSLLGLVRHGGLIPWDDDIDITIPKDTLQLISDNEKEFNKHNIGVVVVDITIMKFIKLYALDEPMIPGSKWSWPFIDVFGYKIKDDNVIVDDCCVPFKHTFKKDDIFPLKQSTFEHINVLIPNKSNEILNKMYKGWETTCISSSYNHRKEHRFERAYNVKCDSLKHQNAEDIFNNAWVINLNSRPDRWVLSEKRLNDIGIHPNRWEATDKKDNEHLEFYDSITGFKRSKGEVACYKSHVLLWKHLYDTNVEAAVIFEDDLIFPSDTPRQDIVDVIERSVGFNIIYLGHCYSNLSKFSDPKTKVGTAQCLHGYVITRDAIEKLLMTEANKYSIPIDKVTEKLCTHELCYISHHIDATLKTYGLGIVHQDLNLGSDLRKKHVSFKGVRI